MLLDRYVHLVILLFAFQLNQVGIANATDDDDKNSTDSEIQQEVLDEELLEVLGSVETENDDDWYVIFLSTIDEAGSDKPELVYE
jgi:hypothetical protein